ncbi:MAG: hypothetical protein MZV64_73740 [Ignavibacteriales bacterium]|nr:hypothetical protein [Ignavibacteriales bacterium]
MATSSSSSWWCGWPTWSPRSSASSLEEDVFPRVRLPRGISYALSRVLTYVLITVGFLLGLGALGLDLTKVTILPRRVRRRHRVRAAERGEQLRLGI